MDLSPAYEEMDAEQLTAEITQCEEVIANYNTDLSDYEQYQSLRTALCELRKKKFGIDFQPFE